MTIPVGSGRMDYTGNGNTPTYSYNWKIFNKNHLLVTERDTDDVEDELTVDTDYTVSGVGEANGGSITLTAGNLTSDYHLTIRELVPIEQATDLRNQGDEYRETQEDALDYLTKIDRQQQDEIDRSFKLSETITGVSSELPIPEASKLFRWNSLANALENVSVASLGVYITGTTMKVVSNVLDLADALVAKLVTNGDSHDHSGGDGAQIDHTTVSNKGTNTHAALDTEYALNVAHRANTSNPHAVTKTQLSLENVTNDAQVKVTDIGTTVLAPTGDGSGLTGIVTSDTITNMTPAGAYTVTTAQCTGRTVLTNAGLGASSVTPTLPVGAANHVIHFNHVDSGNVVITPNGSQHLYVDGVSLGAGVALTSTKKGAKYTCIWNSSDGWWEVNYYNTKATTSYLLTGTDASKSTASFAEFITNTSRVAIVCGASKKIKISISFKGYDLNDGYAYFRITEATAGNRSLGYSYIASYGNYLIETFGTFVYTGLTPGTTYTFVFEVKSDGGNALQCRTSTQPERDFLNMEAETW